MVDIAMPIDPSSKAGSTTKMAPGPSGRKPRPMLSPRNIMVYGALLFAAAYYLLPLYVMVVTSLKGMPEIRVGNIFALPQAPSFAAWSTGRPAVP